MNEFMHSKQEQIHTKKHKTNKLKRTQNFRYHVHISEVRVIESR